MEMMLNKIVPEVSMHSMYWTWYVENVTSYSMMVWFHFYCRLSNIAITFYS